MNAPKMYGHAKKKSPSLFSIQLKTTWLLTWLRRHARFKKIATPRHVPLVALQRYQQLFFDLKQNIMQIVRKKLVIWARINYLNLKIKILVSKFSTQKYFL